jgi:hypothetical protein
MQTDINEIKLNGVDYVRKDSISPATIQTAKDAVLVRCESAGVFYGTMIEHDLATGTAKLSNARRVWYWSGAASLSQLAVDGTAKPNDCKFPVAVPEITVSKVIEVISMTQKALDSLNGVAIWKQ